MDVAIALVGQEPAERMVVQPLADAPGSVDRVEIVEIE